MHTQTDDIFFGIGHQQKKTTIYIEKKRIREERIVDNVHAHTNIYYEMVVVVFSHRTRSGRKHAFHNYEHVKCMLN